VAAGRANWQKRKGLTPEGRERLRQAALINKPWRFSTGPRSVEGKAKVARNSKSRQQGPCSVRELRAELVKLRALAADMREARRLLAGAAGG
jgi:hypothetical protein